MDNFEDAQTASPWPIPRAWGAQRPQRNWVPLSSRRAVSHVDSRSQPGRGGSNRSCTSSFSPSPLSLERKRKRYGIRESDRNVWLLAHSESSDFVNPLSQHQRSISQPLPAFLPYGLSECELENEDHFLRSPTARVALSYTQEIPMQRYKTLKKTPGYINLSSRSVHKNRNKDWSPAVQSLKADPYPSGQHLIESGPLRKGMVNAGAETEPIYSNFKYEDGESSDFTLRQNMDNEPQFSEAIATEREGYGSQKQGVYNGMNTSIDNQVSTIYNGHHNREGIIYNDSPMASNDQNGSGIPFKRENPPIDEPVDPARQLGRQSLILQRIIFSMIIVGLNGGALTAALLSPRHLWVLVFMVFIKSKDITCAILGAIVLSLRSLILKFKQDKEVQGKWILSMISAFSETDDQIMKTVNSVLGHDISPHKQVLCVILDGKIRNTRSHLTTIVASCTRSYVTFRHRRNELRIDAGFIGVHPVILMEKTENAGKKDSLILCHDLFNYTRQDAPLYTKLLKDELFTKILPLIMDGEMFNEFNMIFCTDADSTIHKDAIRNLANAVSRDPFAIAACGVLLAETIPKNKWSTWHLFQQFQYTFGQYIRRQAESLWGKVTCLPGCISMIAVRYEMGGAISLYARPIEDRIFLRHQIQYLGTDRRLTYCMLVQHCRLRTLFVPTAVSETVAPQTLSHYLSQRRRWASNAYFNGFFYLFGPSQMWVTRGFALVDAVRLSLVYYRVANGILFIYGLVKTFTVIEIVPFLVVTQTPVVWYLILVVFREPILRRRAPKLVLGMVINELLSPILSIVTFTIVAFNLGNQAWGRTGLSSESQPPFLDIIPIPSPLRPMNSWTPKRLSTLVRSAIHRNTSRHERSKSHSNSHAKIQNNTPDSGSERISRSLEHA